MRYDRAGDDHYDDLSALMKSLRGSDPDAALHYLARFLESGDLPGACRRILCSASEDIGLAYPQAIAIVKACVDSALQLGFPKPVCRWPTQSSCSPPRRSPIRPVWPSTPRLPMSKPAKPATSRVSCKTSTPTALDSSAIRAISIRTISPATG